MKIFIGNLAWAVTEDDLRKLFSPFGEVERAELASFSDGRRKPFGFVFMPEVGCALKAIISLDHTKFFDRVINVAAGIETEKRGRIQNRPSGEPKIPT